jgi:HSP20 family protein
MTNKDIVRQNEETKVPINRNIGGYMEDYPSFPSLYRQMTNWMQDWDSALNNFVGPRWNWGTRGTNAVTTRSNATRFNPAIDIREGDQGYFVTAELPGIDPKEVEITVQENMLLIKGEKKFEQESKGEGYHRIERSYGSFRRGINLPKGVDTEHIEATFNNGVLNLTLPKLPEVKPQARRIEIKGQAETETRQETPTK